MILNRAYQPSEKTTTKSAGIWKYMVSLGLLAVASMYVVDFDNYGPTSHRTLRRIEREETQLNISGITPFPDICPAEYPPSHAKLHDQYHEELHYNMTVGRQNFLWNRQHAPDDQLPKFHEFENYHYAVWTPHDGVAGASAWDPQNPSLQHLTGPGWIEPKAEFITAEENGPPPVVHQLEGHYVAFNSWFPGNFGHFAHDWLPTMAVMKHVFPPTTKFILVDNPLMRKFLGFLDPTFTEQRVVWIPFDTTFYVKGKLTLHIPVGVPNVYGCCSDWDPLRQWIAEQHPDRPDKNIIIFYTRSGSSDVKHARKLHPDIEQQAIQRIHQKMKQHGRNETLIPFNGQNSTGHTMSIKQQFSLFRTASTFIGPHGSGLGGNFLWMDPFPTTCEERPQILEFMPGPMNPSIHAMYASYFPNIRKWPLDYHTLLYTTASTPYDTQINLDYLDIALDAMWGTPATLVAKEE